MDTIVVAKSEVKNTLVLLLGLADRPQDIWYPGNGVEIDVPSYLAARYDEAVNPKPRRTRANKSKEGEEQ